MIMKYFTLISLILIMLLFYACSKAEIIIYDFESGTYENWIVEGDAFKDGPIQPSEEEINNNPEGGRYYSDSFGGDDNSIGTLTSTEFKIERNYINFLIGGGKHQEFYIELLIDDLSVGKSHSLESDENLNLVAWDVKAYNGNSAVIRIVDNAVGGCGHLMVDDIYQSNKNANTVITNYQLSYDINTDIPGLVERTT